MTPARVSRERWRVLEPLLDAALELEPSKRPAFLSAACGPDTALCDELSALLSACERSDGLLESPATVAYAPLLADPMTSPAVFGDRYHMVREIGRGGMANVYLADDPKHGRQVAVKVLHADVARIIGRERFRREIEIAARLSHPHILPLHDSGEIESQGGEKPLLYFVSPFVAGESLRDRLSRESRLTSTEALRLGREIAQGLDYAHRQGVIHLDVKPGNILLQDGHAVIADFGIARAISTASDQTVFESTPLLGTPSYMSPEQALGAPDVDGRSDVYSLGCVLYEMITGSRPFGSATPTEAIERAKTPRSVDRATLTEFVPRQVAAVILRAMSPNRDDRFRTAGELASALSAAEDSGAVAWRRRGAMVVAGIAVVAAAAVVVRWVQGGAPLDPDLIAVAPFDAEAPSLALWKQGLVDVMSRNLDGAGALRAVPATVVVRRWQGRADARSARALGERTGARLVLFGGLLAAGDSIRATVAILDAKTGHTVAEIEQRDAADRMDRLSDSLTVAVLRELGRARRIDMARLTSAPPTTTSLSALKAYLQGEQFYRAALWDSASTHFERAIALDSTFALAYHKLSSVRRWIDPKEIPDSATYSLMLRTARFTRGLGARERLVATVDSLSALAYFAWRRALSDRREYDVERLLVRRLIATIREGLRQYPDDAELWTLLGRTRLQFDVDTSDGEIDDRAILSAFDNAIAADSTFAPAYLAPITLAAYLNGPASARRYITSYLALDPTGPRSKIIRLADLVLDPARAAKLDVARLVDTLPADALCEITKLLRHVPDSAETLVRIAAAMPAKAASRNAECAMAHAIYGLQLRGHLRAALRMTSWYPHGDQPAVVYNMSRFGMVSDSLARAELGHVLSLAPRMTNTKMYAWWAARGDTAGIQSYLTIFTSMLPRVRSKNELPVMRARLAAGRAFLALARRDTASALDQLLTTTDTLHECWYDNRIATVELLIAKERYLEAATHLNRRWPGTSGCTNGVDEVLWTMYRGRVLERFGRTKEAVESYAFVADAWRTADQELQPYVRESRAALARLNRPRPSS